MITPPFELEQTDAQVIVHVTVPNVKMSEMEYSIVENVFRFYVKPYFLRLTFPRALGESGDDSCEYDAEKQVMHFYLPKKEPGEAFEGLNMISMLLASSTAGPGNTSAEWNALRRDAIAAVAPSGSVASTDAVELERSAESASVAHLKPFPTLAQDLEIGGVLGAAPRRPLIEVIASSDRDATQPSPSLHNISRIRQDTTFSFDWEQAVPSSRPAAASASSSGASSALLEVEDRMEQDDIDIGNTPAVAVSSEAGQYKYGFNAQHSGFFKGFSEDFIEQECLDLARPETTPSAERTLLKQQAEDDKFNEDRFVADFMQQEDFEHVLKYVPRYEKEAARVAQRRAQGVARPCEQVVKWSDTEQRMLANLPKKEYIIQDEKRVYLTMVSILLAFAYNHRTTLGENTVESVWTVSKLSSALSWLEEFDTLSSCLVAFIRRVVCYPLYRSVDLAHRCIKDVSLVLGAGREVTLRCLLETKYLLDHAKDQRYLLSKIFLDDYCVWLQREPDERLALLGQEIARQLVAGDALRRENLPTLGEYPLHDLEQMAVAYAQEFGGEAGEDADEGPIML